MSNTDEIEITSADIKTVLDIINLASSRGALRGNELSVVGGLYDKYLSILEKVKQKAANQN